jgi:hypothetical protein
MSASNEWQERHLTPAGWLDGSTKLDHYRTPTHVEPPADRVLSVTVHDYWPSMARREHWIDEDYRSEDGELVTRLLEQFGQPSPYVG